MTGHVPHVWEPDEQFVTPDERFFGGPARRLLVSDVVCRRCGTRLLVSHVVLVDRIPGYSDCDELLTIAVMES